jgi:hypothetical protein
MEIHMKVKSESVKKSNGHGNGNARDGTGTLESMAGNGDTPREKMVADAAYFNAERRGFAPDSELADWFQAEADVDKQLANHP